MTTAPIYRDPVVSGAAAGIVVVAVATVAMIGGYDRVAVVLDVAAFVVAGVVYSFTHRAM